MTTLAGADLSQIVTPAFVVDVQALERNLITLDSVQQKTGAKVLLALKGFAMWSQAQLVMNYLKGTTASGLHELQLGAGEFGGESHVYSPSYDERSFPQIAAIASHIVFNTPQQWQRFRKYVQQSGREIHCAIRVNPGYSEITVPLYNPCYPRSRLGTPIEHFDMDLLDGIESLHFHTLCEQNADVLERTLAHVERHFGDFIKNRCKSVNFGGGHHITRDDYDVDLLCRTVSKFQDKYGVQVYLEPGEAVGLNCGVLVTQVLDVLKNEIDLAILDTSASTHMPDVLEMPYRPNIIGAAEPNVLPHNYRLGGMTCLAGDVVGDYSFLKPLKPGDKVVFLDMAHYSMVKTTTFNGVPLPAIYTFDSASKNLHLVREFGFQDYKMRLS